MSAGLRDFRGAVAGDLALLSVLHASELDADRLAELQRLDFPDALAFRLQGDFGRDAMSLMREAMNELPDEPSAALLDELAADFAAIYLTNGYGAYPAESVWIDEDGLTMQEPMFQVRDWYQRYGLAVEDWRVRSDDHLVYQLDFLSHVLRDGGDEDLPGLARFMDEHLLRWVLDFARRVASRCATPLYAGLNSLTAAYVDELRDVLAEVLGEARPTPEEIDERMRPKAEVQVAMPERYVPGVAPSW